MTRMITAVGIAGLTWLAAGPALAGPCTDRISALEKTLARADAGSGPTMSTSGGEGGSTAATPREVPKAGEAPGTGGTAGMNAAVGNRATSPGDVRAQTGGTPTAAQQAQSGGKAKMEHGREVGDALRRAKAADARGDAKACGHALDEAERRLKG